MDVAVGFDTSCYTTSVAAVDARGRVVASERTLLPVVSGQRGLRQSEAVFAHIRQVPEVAERVKNRLAGAEIRVVVASVAPRDTEDSYMPVFLVGAGQARTLAALLGVPYVPVSHQQGHIAAGTLDNPPMAERFVALHLSGGTTELLLWERGTLTRLGGTLDLNAGQLIDRAGVRMGLHFPAGSALEKLAAAWPEPAEALLPASLAREDLDCHLSGAETRLKQWTEQGAYPHGKIAAEAFDLLARTVARMIAAGCAQTGVTQALAVGGVASSGLLREWTLARLARLKCPAELRFGKPEYSGDNAAGVAWLGMQQFLAANGRR